MYRFTFDNGVSWVTTLTSKTLLKTIGKYEHDGLVSVTNLYTGAVVWPAK